VRITLKHTTTLLSACAAAATIAAAPTATAATAQWATTAHAPVTAAAGWRDAHAGSRGASSGRHRGCGWSPWGPGDYNVTSGGDGDGAPPRSSTHTWPPDAGNYGSRSASAPAPPIVTPARPAQSGG
jgi:hypothetical protein